MLKVGDFLYVHTSVGGFRNRQRVSKFTVTKINQKYALLTSTTSKNITEKCLKELSKFFEGMAYRGYGSSSSSIRFFPETPELIESFTLDCEVNSLDNKILSEGKALEAKLSKFYYEFRDYTSNVDNMKSVLANITNTIELLNSMGVK